MAGNSQTFFNWKNFIKESVDIIKILKLIKDGTAELKGVSFVNVYFFAILKCLFLWLPVNLACDVSLCG